MNKYCPNCHSTDIYRSHPHSLEICCDTCNHRWQAKQVLIPYFKEKFWLSQPLKGFHYVEVWHSTTDPNKFAYRLAYGGLLFNNLHGEFDSPQLALKAGIEYTKGLLSPQIWE